MKLNTDAKLHLLPVCFSPCACSFISECFPASCTARARWSGIRGLAGILRQLSVLSSLAHHWQPHTLTCSKHTTTYERTLGLFLNVLNLNVFMLLWHASREDINSRWTEGRKRKAICSSQRSERKYEMWGEEFRNGDLFEFYWFLSSIFSLK